MPQIYNNVALKSLHIYHQSSYHLDQGCPTSGPGGACGPLAHVMRPRGPPQKLHRSQKLLLLFAENVYYIYTADFLFCTSELPVCNLNSIPWSYQEIYITQCLHVIGNSFRTSLTGFSTPEHPTLELFWPTQNRKNFAAHLFSG